eukprot:2477022-Pleurochrysis_carterae.AAC.2
MKRGGCCCVASPASWGVSGGYVHEVRLLGTSGTCDAERGHACVLSRVKSSRLQLALVCAGVRVRTCAFARARLHARACASTCVRLRMCASALMRVCERVCVRACVCAPACARAPTLPFASTQGRALDEFTAEVDETQGRMRGAMQVRARDFVNLEKSTRIHPCHRPRRTMAAHRSCPFLPRAVACRQRLAVSWAQPLTKSLSVSSASFCSVLAPLSPLSLTHSTSLPPTPHSLFPYPFPPPPLFSLAHSLAPTQLHHYGCTHSQLRQSLNILFSIFVSNFLLGRQLLERTCLAVEHRLDAASTVAFFPRTSTRHRLRLMHHLSMPYFELLVCR